MLADPKAIKYILHSAGHRYLKTAERAQILKLISGNGIAAVQGLQSFERFSIATHKYNYTGQAHHRQRKILSPAFSSLQVQSFLPLFHRAASKVRILAMYLADAS
jgi:cytochrome P450